MYILQISQWLLLQWYAITMHDFVPLFHTDPMLHTHVATWFTSPTAPTCKEILRIGELCSEPMHVILGIRMCCTLAPLMYHAIACTFSPCMSNQQFPDLTCALYPMSPRRVYKTLLQDITALVFPLVKLHRAAVTYSLLVPPIISNLWLKFNLLMAKYHNRSKFFIKLNVLV